nr:class I SAM-dependent methyltransferase [Eisenbergiella tayi]
MMITDKRIDGGKGFDWGKTSGDYAKYRDIYPPEFYRRILDAGLCIKGQQVLDLGTGTGVLPRYLYPYGAEFTGMDISENQIKTAEKLSEEAGMDIRFLSGPAEQLDFPDGSFDVVTACQCYFYFKHEQLAPVLARVLKPSGRFVILYMAWLPEEDPIAGASEELVLKYNPSWTGRGETRHYIAVPEAYEEYFTVESNEIYDLQIPFTRESWDGRIRACRGIGASLSEEEVEAFTKEHRRLLETIAPEEFTIRHYAGMAVLRKK